MTLAQLEAIVLQHATWINSTIVESKMPSELDSQTDITDSSEVSILQKGTKDAKGVATGLLRGFKGTWAASTNTPTLIDGTGIDLDTYIVTVAGSQDLGSGTESYSIGDRVEFLNGVWYRRGEGAEGIGLSLNTGDLTGGVITVNGGDNTKFDVAAGTGYILDWTDESNPKGTEISWDAFIAVTLPDIGTESFTVPYIVESSTAGIGELSLTAGALPTPQERRQKIQLQTLIHTNLSSITSVGTSSKPAYEITESLLDYILELGTINSGNQVSSNGANLELDKAIGSSTLPFINEKNDHQNPAIKTNVSQTGFTWTKSYQDGSGDFTFDTGNTTVDPDLWDDGSGSLATVSNNKFTIKHFIFFGVNENFNMVYGQTEYSSLAEAKLNIASGTLLTSPLLSSGVCTTVLIVKKGVTDLDAAIIAGTAEFVDCPNSGNSGGAASVGNFITQDTNQLTGNTGDKTLDGEWTFNKQIIKDIDALSNELPIRTLPIDFDWSSIPTGYDNSIWEVVFDFDLTGITVAFPSNVILKFKGGILRDYTELQFDGTEVTGDKYQIFDSSGVFSGSVKNDWLPEWFGAVTFDDTVDDRIAFNKTSNACNELGGGVFKITGNYYLDSRLVAGHAVEVFSNTTVKGNGMYSSLVKLGDNVVGDTPIFLTNSASNIQFSDFEIDGNRQRLVSPIGGEDEGIDIKGGQNVIIKNMFIHDTGMDAIDIDLVGGVGDTIIISNSIIRDCGGVGIHNNFFNTIIDSVQVFNCGFERILHVTPQVSADACGIDILNEDITITNCHIEDCERGINMFAFARSIVSNNTLINNGTVGINVGANITETNGPVSAIISNNQIIGSTEYGIYVNHSNVSLSISDNMINLVAGNTRAIYINDSEGFNISGGYLRGADNGVNVVGLTGQSIINGVTFGSLGSAIEIESVANANLTISNCLDDLDTGSAAIYIKGLTSDVKVLNNILTGTRISVRLLNIAGNPSNITIKDNEATSMTIVGTGHTIERNTGYVTENYGSDTIANSSSTEVVSHGLSITPSFINLSSTTNEVIWYTGITSSQFTVNRTGTSGALNFSWEAK